MTVETYDAERLAAAAPCEMSDHLESGQILYFPACPFALPSGEDQAFLREDLPKRPTLADISYHSEADRIRGIQADPETEARARGILADHDRRVREFLEDAIPALVRGWTPESCSLRWIGEPARDLAPCAGNEPVHVDAGANGATNGDRILRFFVNIDPREDRVWATKGRFPEVYERYGAAAGIRPRDPGPRYLEKGPLGHARTGLVRTLSALGLKMAHVLDSSPYDRTMRRFRDFMKDTRAFQQDAENHREIRFPPFSAWMVFTDMVTHASVSGRFALVTTGIVPLANCRLPELAPINILRAT